MNFQEGDMVQLNPAYHNQAKKVAARLNRDRVTVVSQKFRVTEVTEDGVKVTPGADKSVNSKFFVLCT